MGQGKSRQLPPSSYVQSTYYTQQSYQPENVAPTTLTPYQIRTPLRRTYSEPIPGYNPVSVQAPVPLGVQQYSSFETVYSVPSVNNVYYGNQQSQNPEVIYDSGYVLADSGIPVRARRNSGSNYGTEKINFNL